MSCTSKSPRKVAIAALAVGKRSLPAYAHRFAPRKFTQPQLFACLALKHFFKTDYRGIATYLKDLPELCQAIGLDRVPHFTTLQKAARRLLRCVPARRLLNATVTMVMKRRRHVALAAVDSTGFESRHVSPYFVRRRGKASKNCKTRVFTPWPKLGILCDCRNHLILAVHTSRGPTPDVNQLLPLLDRRSRHVIFRRLVADAGYDSESNHQALRDGHGIVSLIRPATRRATAKPATGRYRRLMQRLFKNTKRTHYGQRWQVETLFSMIKRNLGHALAARTYWAQCREMMMLALTHNLMILWLAIKVFYRASKCSCINVHRSIVSQQAKKIALGNTLVSSSVDIRCASSRSNNNRVAMYSVV
jgi:hypothetical protein